MAKISIIIPCYFNELNIPKTVSILLKNETAFPAHTNFEYIMIDDGSKDGTLQELLAFKESNPAKVKIVKLSGNFGSYNAILAGMHYATGDCNIIISADLQDPVSLMPRMFDYWLKGVKLVIANRQDRKDSFFNKYFAIMFQWLIRKYALPNLPKGGFDYVLFDKRLKNEVLAMDEKNSNSLYLLLWMKHDYVAIPYVRENRELGKSKWTIRKKIKLFIDSFIAFSFMPIRAITLLGLILAILSVSYGVFLLYMKINGFIKVEGWTTVILLFLFVSSFQMIALGVIGEYLWRTLDSSRKRPNFIIDEVYD